MIKRVLFFVILLALATTPAHAAQQCYSLTELKAEQLIRLHSELMVITVTCHQSSQGDNLVPFYTGFTQRNLKKLHNAEQTLIHHYKICYGGSGIDQLDKLRTRLGNEYGQKIADQSAPLFCTLWRDKVIQMYGATPEQVDAEVQSLMKTGSPYERMCQPSGAPLASKGQ
jgi:hypothetical protein